MVQNNMFVPGKVENWMAIIEMKNFSLFSLPYKVLSRFNKTIQKVIKIMTENFLNVVEKQFILNAPYLMRKSWSIVESLFLPLN